MANAKKLPSGNWRVQAKKNGEIRSFTSYDKKIAESLALQWQIKAPSGNNNKLLLSYRIDSYIDSRRNIISPVTIKTYEGYKRRYLLDLQKMQVNKITHSQIQNAFNELAAKLSPKTIKNVFGMFQAAMGDDMPKGKIVLPKIYKPTYNTPDITQGKKILELVKNTDIELPVNLALRCGLRISEICGLKWSAVTDGYISIDNVIVAFGTDKIEKPPKSAAGKRKIPITPEIKKLIDNQPRVNDYVCQKDANAIRVAFSRLLKRNGIEHIKFHELRHAFASNMALLGIPEAYAKAIGGWDTSAVMHNIYEQTYAKQQEEFSHKIQQIYG